jgi:hypothetical protein
MISYAISIKYMLAGYVIIFIVLGTYIVSLFIRWQRFKRDLETIRNLEKEIPAQ